MGSSLNLLRLRVLFQKVAQNYLGSKKELPCRELPHSDGEFGGSG